MSFDENVSGNKLLKSSSSIVNNDSFNIIEEFGSTIPVFIVPTLLINYSPNLIDKWSTMNSRFNIMTSINHSNDAT